MRYIGSPSRRRFPIRLTCVVLRSSPSMTLTTVTVGTSICHVYIVLVYTTEIGEGTP